MPGSFACAVEASMNSMDRIPLADRSRSAATPPILVLSRYTRSPDPPVCADPPGETPPSVCEGALPVLLNHVGLNRWTASYALRNPPASISAAVMRFWLVLADDPDALPADAHAAATPMSRIAERIAYARFTISSRKMYEDATTEPTPGDAKALRNIAEGFRIPASGRPVKTTLRPRRRILVDRDAEPRCRERRGCFASGDRWREDE